MTERPSRAQAANFVTGTPLPTTRNKRCVFGDISNNRMDVRHTSAGHTPSRTRGKSISATPTSKYSSVKRRKIDHSPKSSEVNPFVFKIDSKSGVVVTESLSSNFPSKSGENIASHNASLEPDVDEKSEVSAQKYNYCLIS